MFVVADGNYLWRGVDDWQGQDVGLAGFVYDCQVKVLFEGDVIYAVVNGHDPAWYIALGFAEQVVGLGFEFLGVATCALADFFVSEFKAF